MKTYNTIIIGSGVAGMTAALYLKRSNIDFCIIEKEAPGGELLRIPIIKNYPGVRDISGTDLAQNFYEQTKELNVEYIFQEVLSIEKENDMYKIILANNILLTKNIILAIGRTPNKLGIEKDLSGKGISWCTICDGPLYKNKPVAVIGGGRSALEGTIYLSKICSKVTLICRKDTFRVEDKLVDEVKSIENVEILMNTEVKEFISSDDKLDKIKLSNNEEIDVDCCFELIGQIPNTELLKNLDILDDKGYILVNNKYETKEKNIFACGDCIKKNLYQIVTACSEGAEIAVNIIKSNK